ncbi:MAG: hypothetical protein QOE75_369 [Solirubrobacterales bacterium]|nr:hypothetical protein [Solirubrobacterales bacterium]
MRLFHTPSGNVACAILSDGATCSVLPTNETFVLESGSVAWSEAGVAFPGDAGDLAPYGTSLEAGQVSCSIPASNEPRGVVCTDSVSGHGFEASRVESRQSTF